MKYSLTLNFETKEELQAFLAEGNSETAHVEEKPKAARGAKAKKTEDVLADVKLPDPVKEAPSIFPKEEIAAPAPTPIAQAPEAPAFDKAKALADISKTVADLKAQSVPDQTIASLFSNAFGQLGIAGKKIGELEDEVFARFQPCFYAQVANLKDMMAPKTETNSFI